MLDDIEIVDAHHHLWDLNGLRYPFLSDDIEDNFFLGDYAEIRHDYLPEDYRRDSARHNVVKTVHIEAECDRANQIAETRWITAVNARHGFPNAIIGHAWFDRDNSEEILAAQAEFPLVRGIRSKPVTASAPDRMNPGAPGTMQHPDWLAGFALLEKYDLSWDLRVPCWHLEEAAVVARDHPETQIVLNHTGFPWDRGAEGLALWRRGMRALAAAPNVHLKISCLCLPDGPWTLESNRPIVLEAIDIFGAERCMFASNYPVDSLRASFDLIYNSFKTIVAEFPRADQERMFSKNASAFYRI